MPTHPITENPLSGSSVAGTGVGGTSGTGVGVWGQSFQPLNPGQIPPPGFLESVNDGVLGEGKNGVHGKSSLGNGVLGENSSNGAGVAGSSVSGAGVTGSSQSGPGVRGQSQNADGVNALSSSPNHTGVFGANNSGGRGVAGLSNSNSGVDGHSTSGPGVSGSSVSGEGIVGSGGTNGIRGETKSDANVGVWARNFGAGAGLAAETANGIGLVANFGLGVVMAPKASGLAAQFNGNVEVNGTVNCSGDINLMNADCAEDFELALYESADPGTVMVLGSGGMLHTSRTPYDRRVAGIISGAGDYKPAILLGKQEASANRVPIALIGKAFCKVDANHGSIEVGDLLTTSTTPGHAMRANDPNQSFGSIIGKALRPLKSGCALVPILVALQ